MLLAHLFEKNVYWQDAVYWIVENCKKEIRKEQNIGGLKSMISYYFSQISRVIVRHCLDAYLPKYGVLQVDLAKKYYNAISQVLKKHMSIHNVNPLFLEFNYSLVDGSYAAFIEIISPLVNSLFNKKIIEEEIKKLNKFLTELLKKVQNELQERTGSSNNLVHCLSTKSFRTGLANYFQMVTHRIFIEMLRSIVRLKLIKNDNVFERSFITSQLASCFKGIIKQEQRGPNYHIMPYHIRVDDMDNAFRSIFEELNSGLKRYKIFFITSNIDPNNKIFKVNDVTFYDPSVWNFEEHPRFEPLKKMAAEGNDHHDRKKIAVASKEIDSLNKDDAIEKAYSYVERALDALVFISITIPELTKPRIHTYYQAVNVKEESLDLQASFRDVLLRPLEFSTNILEFVKKYDILISDLDESSPHTYTIKQSLTLLRLGLGAETDYLRFVSYWNALEMLVTIVSLEKTIKTKLIRKLPLFILWKQSNNLSRVISCIDYIYSTVGNNRKLQFRLDNHPKLRLWRKDRIIIVKYFSKIKRIWREVLKTTDDLNELESLLSINSKLEYREVTMRLEFQIALLYEKRNLLFHEGKGFSLLSNYVLILHRLLSHVASVFILISGLNNSTGR